MWLLYILIVLKIYTGKKIYNGEGKSNFILFYHFLGYILKFSPAKLL